MINAFNHYLPTRIIFGRGKLGELGNIASNLGKTALVVSVSDFPGGSEILNKTIALMELSGMTVVHFDGVIPNPTTDVVSAGAKIAEENNVDVVVGIGGGSSMDTAKAIAVEATHEGTAWDYLFYKKEPTPATLPVVLVPTTSGTGSHTTQCAVITKSDDEDKSALWHDNLFARAAIVDPDLPATMPSRLTAMTGFDAFCHNFEAFISRGTNIYVKSIALHAIELIAEYLPRVVADGSDMDAREAMCWADTLGGMAFSSAGVTLPHGLGMQISGHCPHVPHGASLAVQYPSFFEFTWSSAVADFARVGRILDPALIGVDDRTAAKASCKAIEEFLGRINLQIDLKTFDVGRDKIRIIADAGQVLPDYKNNPRIATTEEMYELLVASYDRKIK